MTRLLCGTAILVITGWLVYLGKGPIEDKPAVKTLIIPQSTCGSNCILWNNKRLTLINLRGAIPNQFYAYVKDKDTYTSEGFITK